ncbi:hypothetical protein DMENIID0001_153120 [Sergentomyia squamirostris]
MEEADEDVVVAIEPQDFEFLEVKVEPTDDVEDLDDDQENKSLLSRRTKIKTNKVPEKREGTNAKFVKKNFPGRVDLELHVRSHSMNNSLKCPKCGKSFQSQLTLNRHSRSHNFSVKNMVCNICDAVFKDENDFVNHKRFHITGEPAYSCEYCHEAFETQSAISAHKAQKHKTEWECRHCSESFRTEKLFLKHKQKHETAQCPCCGMKFLTQELMEVHVQEMGDHGPPDDLVESSSSGVYACAQCDKRFTRRNCLLQHSRLHTGIGMLDCVYCPLKFTSPARLKKHMRTHDDTNNYPCPHCDKVFRTERYLKLHSLIHSMEKLPHTCHICGKGFVRINALHYHINGHLKRFPCSSCSEVFTSDRKLKEHRRSHKSICEICDVRYDTMELLRAHNRDYHEGLFDEWNQSLHQGVSTDNQEEATGNNE